MRTRYIPVAGGGSQVTVRQAWVETGNIALPNTSSVWTPVSGLTLAVPAAVGDYVELITSFMWESAASVFLDGGNLVGGAIERYASSGDGTPAAAGEGDPCLYPGSTFIKSGFHFGFTVAADDLDGANVTFAMLVKSAGVGATIYASANYPFRWTAKNLGVSL